MHRIPKGIGFLGGTFDPVHAGHLALARAALDALGLAQVEFLPAGDPWQKSGVTAARHRLAMLRLALQGEPRMRINTIELEHLGPTFTIETVEVLRRRVGKSLPLVLIIGGDQWKNFHTWRAWRDITGYVHLAVCSRSGAPLSAPGVVTDWARPKETAPEALLSAASGRIAFFSMPPHRAESREIRRRLLAEPFDRALGQLPGWLSLSVANYIRSSGLYARRTR